MAALLASPTVEMLAAKSAAWLVGETAEMSAAHWGTRSAAQKVWRTVETMVVPLDMTRVASLGPH
jgi:hypothetical protein